MAVGDNDDTRTDLVEKLAEIKLRRGDFSGLLPLAERLASGAEGNSPRGARRACIASAAPARRSATRAARWRATGRRRWPRGVRGQPVKRARGAARRGGDLADMASRREAWDEAAARWGSRCWPNPGGAPGRRASDRLRAPGPGAATGGRAGGGAGAPEKALRIDPKRNRALEALVQAAHEAGNDETVVRHTQALLAVTEDPKTKLALLERLAVIHRDRRNDPLRAIAAYLEALQIWPDERALLHRLLELYSDTKQWKHAVQLLARLAALNEGTLRARYLVAAGNILIEEIWRRPPRRGGGVRASAGRRSARPVLIFERVDRGPW